MAELLERLVRALDDRGLRTVISGPRISEQVQARVLCVPLRLLLFRIDKRVDAHGVKSRGGGRKCAHLCYPAS
jgi:hypothetical protein